MICTPCQVRRIRNIISALRARSWDESKHPRDEDGKFADSSSSHSSLVKKWDKFIQSAPGLSDRAREMNEGNIGLTRKLYNIIEDKKRNHDTFGDSMFDDEDDKKWKAALRKFAKENDLVNRSDLQQLHDTGQKIWVDEVNEEVKKQGDDAVKRLPLPKLLKHLKQYSPEDVSRTGTQSFFVLPNGKMYSHPDGGWWDHAAMMEKAAAKEGISSGFGQQHADGYNKHHGIMRLITSKNNVGGNSWGKMTSSQRSTLRSVVRHIGIYDPDDIGFQGDMSDIARRALVASIDKETGKEVKWRTLPNGTHIKIEGNEDIDTAIDRELKDNGESGSTLEQEMNSDRVELLTQRYLEFDKFYDDGPQAQPMHIDNLLKDMGKLDEYRNATKKGDQETVNRLYIEAAKQSPRWNVFLEREEELAGFTQALKKKAADTDLFYRWTDIGELDSYLENQETIGKSSFEVNENADYKCASVAKHSKFFGEREVRIAFPTEGITKFRVPTYTQIPQVSGHDKHAQFSQEAEVQISEDTKIPIGKMSISFIHRMSSTKRDEMMMKYSKLGKLSFDGGVYFE